MKRFTAMSVMALALLGAAAAIAQAPPATAPAAPPTAPAPPTERQAVMQSNRTASAGYSELAIGIMNPATAKTHAQTLIDNGAKIAVLFAPGTDQNDPRAKPEIWTNPAGFKAANDKFIANARKLQAAIPNRIAMTEAMRDVQADCTACHQAFRVMPAAAAGAGRGGRGRGAAADAPAAAAAGAAAPAAEVAN